MNSHDGEGQAGGAEIPLPTGLHELDSRVAEVWVDDRIDGYLFTKLDVWHTTTGPFWNRRRSPSTERLEFMIVRLDEEGRLVEFVNDVIRDDTVDELAADRFTLRGVEGRLVWLDEPAATLARTRYLA